jgi:hypothetical protein
MANGNVIVNYSQGYSPSSTTWYLVANKAGLVVNPQRTWASVDSLAGLNANTLIASYGSGKSYLGGQYALFALGASGLSNGTGGYAVEIDQNGNVVSRFGGNGWYQPTICAVGSEVNVQSELVDPVGFELRGFNNATTANVSQNLWSNGVNYNASNATTCGIGTNIGSYAVIARAQPGVKLGLQQYLANAGSNWSLVGSELAIPINTVNTSHTINDPDVAVADTNGVMVFDDLGSDGRRQLFYVRFTLSSAGPVKVDATPVAITSSASYEGLAAAVIPASCENMSAGCSASNDFYISVYQGGNSANGQATNTAQVLSIVKLDFSTGALSTLASYRDTNWSNKAPAATTTGDSTRFPTTAIGVSCDGNVYQAGAIDGGSGVDILKVFALPVTSPTC